MRKWLFFLAFSLTSTLASAALRTLPPGGFVAELEAFEVTRPLSLLKLDGKVFEAAPGLQIRGVKGELIPLPKMATDVNVYAVREARTGYVWRMWVLSADELAELKPVKKPFVTRDTASE
ncbi:hypothetical protein [Chitinilyticum litopenaei]|uniref:hypothetical protein n=1 Tax=Chitinilyticum litopenaei TaxID=1121276 RepID=UPI0004215226|nr:hypothetical protein [Chitinilyticum litopenaei]